MSTLGDFANEAIDGIYRGELAPVLALCDWLQDRGDGRGVRLKTRIKRFQVRTGKHATMLKATLVPKSIDYLENLIRIQRDQLVSYVMRLLSVADGAQLLPEYLMRYGTIVEPLSA